MSIFYKDGNRNSNMRINTDGKLFKWLENNYYVDGNQLLISGDVLEAIQDQQPELEQNEAVLVGHLIYNLEYNGGYIFREILSFEDLIDEIEEKHLTGSDLIESNEYDTVMLVRCIENNQDALNEDEAFWSKSNYWKRLNHIYGHYCTTQLNEELINHNAIKKAIKML